MNLLEQIQNLSTDELGESLIPSSRSVRITPGVDPNTNQPHIGYTDVDGTTTYHIFKNLVLTRVSARKQRNDMTVLSFNFSTIGEELGIINTEQEEGEGRIPLQSYTSQAFARWRTWYHLVNAEFQNPSPEAVQKIHQIIQEAGFTTFKMVPRFGQTTLPERTSEILFDLRAPGGNLASRHSKGINVTSATILPADRVGPMTTEYVNAEDETISRKAFTSFPDVFLDNMKTIAKAKGLEGDERREAEREAINRMALLTGSNEAGFALRPTLGYLSLEGQDEEISFFPEREDETIEVPEELTEYMKAKDQESDSEEYEEEQPF